jgi:pilus assembly protein Flp/PilA
MDPLLHFTAFIDDEHAVTAIEYGLLAALIAVAAIVGISATGASLTALYIQWTGAVAAAL